MVGAGSLPVCLRKRETFPTARLELHSLLDRAPLAGVPLLVVRITGYVCATGVSRSTYTSIARQQKRPARTCPNRGAYTRTVRTSYFGLDTIVFAELPRTHSDLDKIQNRPVSVSYLGSACAFRILSHWFSHTSTSAIQWVTLLRANQVS